MKNEKRVEQAASQQQSASRFGPGNPCEPKEQIKVDTVARIMIQNKQKGTATTKFHWDSASRLLGSLSGRKTL
jgi:hypothetical protein